MKTINPTLTAMQKQPNAQAIARASLADSGRLHPATVFTDATSGGLQRAANCGTFLVRIRTVSATGKLQYQKITDPTVESQWEAWTDLATGLSSALSAALFWTGTYAVAVWQESATGNVRYARTSDGASWSAAATAYAALGTTRLYPADGGSAQSGVFVFHTTQLYWGAYNPGADTWAALNSSATAAMTGAPEGDAFYDSANNRHVLLWAPPTAVFGYSRHGLAVTTRTTGGVWTHVRPYIQSDANGCRNISVSKSQINGLWACTFTRQTQWADDSFYLSYSADGLFWESPQRLPLDTGATGNVNLIGQVTGYSGYYLANELAVLRSDAQTFWEDQAVVRYDLISGSTSARVAGGRAPHLVVVLDNRPGLGVPELYSLLTLERGFRVAGTDYYVSAGTYLVSGFRYRLDSNLLEVQAIDAIGLLTTFVSDTSYNWRSHTVQNLVTAICALAGLHAVSFDGSGLWAETISSFTLPANANGREALEDLRERVPFDYVVSEAGAVSFYVPTAAPSSSYTYGRDSGEHTYWPGEFGQADTPNAVRIVGQNPRSHGGISSDEAAISAAGRMRTAYVLDRRVTSVADADALAAAWEVFYRERAKAGDFEAPPNFALEVGDVISFAGPPGTYQASAGPWRVEQIQELFNPPNTKKYVQRIHLRGTT